MNKVDYINTCMIHNFKIITRLGHEHLSLLRPHRKCDATNLKDHWQAVPPLPVITDDETTFNGLKYLASEQQYFIPPTPKYLALIKEGRSIHALPADAFRAPASSVKVLWSKQTGV